jgi:hypothetical protein
MSGRAATFHQLLQGIRGGRCEPGEWAPIVELASETLTIATLADSVLDRDQGRGVPEDVRDLLVDVRDRALQRNARLTDQFFELLPVLNRAGITPIPMRGMARLLSSANEGARLLSDIDLLIPSERRQDVIKALAGLDYQIFDGRQDEPFPAVLARTRDVGMVDVHTILEPFYLKLEYEQIAPLCSLTRLGSGEVLLPSPTCQLMFIILHDQLHDGDYWRGLIDVRHIIDMARLIEGGIDWPTLGSMFHLKSTRNALHVQLRTARALMKVDVPPEYCGGLWSALQVARRRMQARIPVMRPLFTLLTVAADRPERSGSILPRRGLVHERGWEKLRRRLSHYLRPSTTGKLRKSS